MNQIKSIHKSSRQRRAEKEGQLSMLSRLTIKPNKGRDEFYGILPTAFNVSMIEAYADVYLFESLPELKLAEWLYDWLNMEALQEFAIEVQVDENNLMIRKDCYCKPNQEYENWQLLTDREFEYLRHMGKLFTCQELADYMDAEYDYDSAREMARRKMHEFAAMGAVEIDRTRTIGENEHMQAKVCKPVLEYLKTI